MNLREWNVRVVVTEGEGTATVDGAVHPLAPGVLVPLPLGNVLSITNGSTDCPLRYLIIKAEPRPMG